MKYDEIIDRLGYFRNNANLSARETSLRLGYNPQFIKTIENKKVKLKVDTLLDFCDIVGISIYDFFYLGNSFNKDRKEFLDLFLSLPDNKKDLVIEIMKSYFIWFNYRLISKFHSLGNGGSVIQHFYVE